MKQFDILVIGAGPGGYVAAIRASQLGFKVGVIEREALGGICLNWGCIPTKALLKSAQVFEYISHSEEYGIKTKGAEVEFDAIIKRSRDVAGGMSKGVQFLFKKNKIEAIMGSAHIKANRIVEVTNAEGKVETYTANHIILATGARSRQLPGIEQDGKHIIGYREAMTLKTQPKSMVVVGSGAIGVEFAYLYAAIGTEVTIVEYQDRILPREDKDVSKEMAKIFKKKGIKLLTESQVLGVKTTKGGCSVEVKDLKKGSTSTLQADIVLSAVGVTPNTDNLGLEEAGIKVERGIVQVDDYYRTSAQGVYAIGDIVKGPALAHVASAEGILCVEKIAGHDVEPLDYGNLPNCTYSVPEVASVGMTEDEAKEAGYTLKIGKFPFSASGKASAAGAKEGFVKVIFDAKYGEWLGAHFIGANVTEMIAEVVTARKLETTGHEIIKAVHPHPTMSEAVMEAAAAAYDEVIHL